MKFKKITFKNYRCFCNSEVVFNERNDKNINILIGPNGGGKTELLFSFWWVLYGFDFKSLTSKENTPYALNSDLYKQLELSKKGTKQECTVVLELENENKFYIITKTSTFRKTEQKVVEDVTQYLSKTEENGETSVPITDETEIKRVLNKIIPTNVLCGILFDGERMQKLSSPTENAKKAIQGVIKDITNVSLIDLADSSFKNIRKELHKENRNIAKKNGDQTSQDIINDIMALEEQQETLTNRIKENETKLENDNLRLEQISSELFKIKDIQEFVGQRKIVKTEIENGNKNLDSLYKDFVVSLGNGYVIRSDDLLDTARSNLESHDIPEGLTTDAVRNIIERKTCICGRELHKEEIDLLNDLITKLPPDNISSTLCESIRHSKEDIIKTKDNLSRDYNRIKEEEKHISDLKKQLSELNTLIGDFDNENAQELNNENNRLSEEIGSLKGNIARDKLDLSQCVSDLTTKKAERENLGKNQKETKKITAQLNFIDKSLEALNKVKESNTDKALTDINVSLSEAYKKLSEDVKLGREIYIIKYDPDKQYQMVVYLLENYKKLNELWKENGTYTKLRADGFSEEQIKEKIIIKCIDSSSTGQSKMNTLSFVKAILDYSNKSKDSEEFSIKKSYPFLIDAPFGDIAGDNLINSAKELHNFSEQIILMLDTDKYKNIHQYLDPYISRKYKFNKQKGNHTLIELMED